MGGNEPGKHDHRENRDCDASADADRIHFWLSFGKPNSKREINGGLFWAVIDIGVAWGS
jgi:hypothetical protein